jgi:periplasmic iron binding protein
MFQRWAGPMVVALIFAGVILVLALNLNLKGRGLRRPNEPGSPAGLSLPPQAAANGVRLTAGFREYPIGDEVERNQMVIAAVYLPPVQMEGMPVTPSAALIHLEADVRATAGNRNGFANNENITYLVVHYKIVPRDAEGKEKSAESFEGKMWPMMARDGFHYGASIEMPRAGRYTLTYAFEPPSAGGLGRHADRVTGVDPWWKPFDVSFDWDYPGPPPPEP